MSEFMEAHSVSKLIGAPPGFIGHEQRGQLTERVRSQPYSVVLLDEVEKAHAKILDLFLQVLDSGTLTDAHGLKCDFRETIIIMTSNLGAGAGKRPIGFGGEIQIVDTDDELVDSVQSAVKRFFRPEFLNRLTGVVVFQPLEKLHLYQILSVIVERLNRRLGEMGVSLELTTEAMAFLIQEGCRPESGARGLERTVDKALATPLSKFLLRRKVEKGKIFRFFKDSSSEVLRIE
jgi:ATP-dependent Clp protease ATP-binding subunit ClpA